MERNCLDVKLNVKPVFCFFSHRLYYEGPCRMAGGDALKPGFDDVLNGQIKTGILKGLENACPKDVAVLMEPNEATLYDDWERKESYMDELLRESEKTDVYVLFTSFGADYLWREFGRKCGKPVIIVPNIWNPMKSAYYYNFGVEYYAPYDWQELTEYLCALRARKAISTAKVLLAVRFADTMPMAGADDSFRSLEEVTEKFGTEFRTINFHELMDQMNERAPEGNYTTPGRDTTPNVSTEDIAELEKLANELEAGAEKSEISREYLMSSLRIWKAVKKNMEFNDCSAFTVPCPDVCSTRRLNESKCTFCLCHQLNNERGIPSACKYDIAAALTMMAQICLTGEAPYMANTLPIIKSTGGKEQWITQIPEEDRAAVKDTDNLYCVNMSPQMRKTHGIANGPDRYSIRHFAYDQGFGAVFHHDFDDDIGRSITLARISGDCKRLLIVKGEIVKGYGYDLHNCNGGYIFRVSDGRRLYKEQARTGLMLPMVFGDHVRKLELFAEVMGLEAVVV